LEIFNLKCDTSNTLRILKNWDVIVDATDNLSPDISSMMPVSFWENPWFMELSINMKE